MSLEAYERIIESEDRSRMGGDDASRRLEHLTNVAVMLESWIKDARSVMHGSRNGAMDQLSKALATGVLLSKIEEYKSQVQALPMSALDLESRLGAVEVAVTHMR
jgi:hypothetical protein